MNQLITPAICSGVCVCVGVVYAFVCVGERQGKTERKSEKEKTLHLCFWGVIQSWWSLPASCWKRTGKRSFCRLGNHQATPPPRLGYTQTHTHKNHNLSGSVDTDGCSQTDWGFFKSPLKQQFRSSSKKKKNLHLWPVAQATVDLRYRQKPGCWWQWAT